MDDMLLVGPVDHLTKLKTDIHKVYPLKDLGEVRDTIFLGLRIQRNDNKFTIDQARYVKLIADKFHVDTPSSIPMESRFKPRSADDIPPFDTKKYQSAIGSLLYLALGTRPDIAFTVNRLAQFASHPNVDHWQAITKLIGYVLGTADFGITLGEPLVSDDNLSGYFDASYGDNADGHSTCGYIFFYRGHPISWRSKKQQMVCLSSSAKSHFRICPHNLHFNPDYPENARNSN